VGLILQEARIFGRASVGQWVSLCEFALAKMWGVKAGFIE